VELAEVVCAEQQWKVRAVGLDVEEGASSCSGAAGLLKTEEVEGWVEDMAALETGLFLIITLSTQRFTVETTWPQFLQWWSTSWRQGQQ